MSKTFFNLAKMCVFWAADRADGRKQSGQTLPTYACKIIGLFVTCLLDRYTGRTETWLLSFAQL
jgi:hypothetical protein